MKVRIFPANQTYFRFKISDSTIYDKINDRFSFELPVFLKNKYYEEKLSIIKARNLLHVGLFWEFVEFLESNNIEYSIEGTILQKEKIETQTLQTFIERLKLLMELYQHQFDAVKTVIENKRSVILSPTSSGKSMIIAVLAGYFLCLKKNVGKKFMLIVPNKFLVNQMKMDIISYYRNSDIKIGDYIQCIHSEIPQKERDLTKPIIITTWQSQKGTDFKFEKQFNNEFMSTVEMLVYDEVQYAAARESRYIIESAVDTPYKIGLTGTLYDDNEYKNTIIKGLFGDITQFITTREMIDMGMASELDIYQVKLDFGQEKPADYNGELEAVRESEAYLDYVLKLVGTQCKNGNTLVLHRGVKYGEKALQRFRQLFPGRECYLINGGVLASKRQKIKEILEKKNGIVLFATYGTTSTGVSIQNLQYGVFLEGMKANIKVIQALGRLLRKLDTKSKATVFDFVPCFDKYGSLQDHGAIRLKQYQREEHIIKSLCYKI